MVNINPRTEPVAQTSEKNVSIDVTYQRICIGMLVLLAAPPILKR